jgi:hypothetical protein
MLITSQICWFLQNYHIFNCSYLISSILLQLCIKEQELKEIYRDTLHLREYMTLVKPHKRIHVAHLPNYKNPVTRVLPNTALLFPVLVVMAKLILSLLAVWVLQVALASGACLSSSGPSPYEYDIDKQMLHRENMRNLVAGWRQYDDRLLFK